MTGGAIARARTAFAEAFGAPPEGVAFAPGRVNLIGDHVDYNDGLVLPMPLALGTAVAWRRRADGLCAANAADYAGEGHLFNPAIPPQQGDGWRSLVHGMAWLLHAQPGPARTGLDLLIAGDLPRGAGLSSSASLCIAIGHALAAGAGQKDSDAAALAQLAQQAEHRFAGVSCGIMDQMVIAAGKCGAAMLLDCRSLAFGQVALPADWSVIVTPSGVVRELVDGAYNARRAECESAARKLQVASLRDIDPAAADFSRLDPAEARRARHVVSEIDRTRLAAQAMAAGDIVQLGGLLRESHASMRDDFEASHPEVDRQVDALNAIIGANGGARMTGGGFGGAIVAVCRAADTGRITQALKSSGAHSTIRAFN